MLSIDVCKACINRFHALGQGYRSTPWHKSDEVRWERGEVMCPAYIQHVYVEVPDWCVRKFEHGVAAGMSNEDE